MADVDLSTAFNLTPSLLEQLGKALVELESHKDNASETVSFTEISDHFRDLEAKLMKKHAELEAKEKAFKQEESKCLSLLAAKEVVVAEKEQDMVDRIQVLKDAAVAAIAETRATHIMDRTENKVSCSSGETKESSGKTAVNNEVSFHQELTQFCEKMDTKGLLTFVTENRKNMTVLRKELGHALKSSTKPCRLVLDSLEGFYPCDEDNNNNEDNATLQLMRQSCFSLMEALNTMLASSDDDHLLSLEIKQEAKLIADEWKLKLANIDATDRKSLECEAFLQLLAAFRIASEFDEDELCKLFVVAACKKRQPPELCRSLGLAYKMPGVIKELISKGRVISAVLMVHAFELVEDFPTVPLLKTYLKDLRRSLQGKRENSQKEKNVKEREALRVVIHCIKKYNLEADYPLDPLQRTVDQLEKAKGKTGKKKRSRDSSNKPSYNEKKRSKGGSSGYEHHSPGAASLVVNEGQVHDSVYMDIGAYGDGYPCVGGSDHYNYQAPSQSMYSQQLYEYYHPPDAGYMPSYQPYM